MRERVDIMGVPIDKVTIDKALQRFKELNEYDPCSMIVTPNTEIVMEAQKDMDVLEVLKASDLVIPDGIGLIYASRILNKGLPERVPGIDLMQKILEYCNEYGKSIYIFGGKPGVADEALKNISKTFPNIRVLGTRNGYFGQNDEAEIIEKINQLKPDVLFVALGAPKQEKWIYYHKDQLKIKVAMGVGGSVDVWAGTVQRAPKIYQKLGLEWFYRLLKEPWRYKRMMVLPKFMIQVIWRRIVKNQID